MQSTLSVTHRVELINTAVAISALASDAICAVYNSPASLVVEHKGDQSPVTEADKRAHTIIEQGLSALTPKWPVLSEEQLLPDFSVRSLWPCYWLVDPLDGTREFIERTGEFTINIALIENGLPVLGVVYLPLQKCGYCGVAEYGAWVESSTGKQSISVQRDVEKSRVRVLTSRRHAGGMLDECLLNLSRNFSAVEQTQVGSALKFCWLAEGRGDIYPRFTACCEWDTAAGQAVLEAAGGRLLGTDFKPWRYNCSESIINPHFYALGSPEIDWITTLNRSIN